MNTSTTISSNGRRVKYLNNRDLLTEIHRSKCSFSSFTLPEYHQHDAIVDNMSDIDSKVIEEAKLVKIKRIGLTAFTILRNAGDKVTKLSEVTPDVTTIDTSSLIFRVKTYDHIPMSPGRKKTNKTESDLHDRVNFPPFQHWKFNSVMELECVGKSHWVGDLETGNYSRSHGRISENLGKMFIKLSERYSQRSNWRGYTYLEEMKGQAILQLSHVGLQFDESKSENPFAYYSSILSNAFTRVLNLEKKSQDIRDDLLEAAGLMPSMTRQNKQAFGEEIARQANIYKNYRAPKSVDSDYEPDTY